MLCCPPLPSVPPRTHQWSKCALLQQSLLREPRRDHQRRYVICLGKFCWPAIQSITHSSLLTVHFPLAVNSKDYIPVRWAQRIPPAWPIHLPAFVLDCQAAIDPELQTTQASSGRQSEDFAQADSVFTSAIIRTPSCNPKYIGD